MPRSEAKHTEYQLVARNGAQPILLLLSTLSTGILAKILLQPSTGQFLRALQTLSTGSVYYPGQYSHENTCARVYSVHLDGFDGYSLSLLARTRCANSRTVAKPWQFVSQVTASTTNLDSNSVLHRVGAKGMHSLKVMASATTPADRISHPVMTACTTRTRTFATCLGALP